MDRIEPRTYNSCNNLPFPKISKPQVIGAFSVNQNREVLSGKLSLINLKYLKIPNPPRNLSYDLNRGDDTYVHKPESAHNEKLSHLFRFIQDNPHLIIDGQLNTDFVCFRGLLRLIMCTPYENQEGWIILATKFNGTIYLCAEETPKKVADRLNKTENDKKFCRYWRENALRVSDSSTTNPTPNEPVLEGEEFCTMFGCKLNGKRLMYGAEVDGIDSLQDCQNLEQLKTARFVEVKVKRRESNQRQLSNFYRFKARNFWSQCFLVGIDRVHVGIRNDEGIVEEIKEHALKELVDNSRNMWSPSNLLTFCDEFLEQIKFDMSSCNDPNLIYRYEYNQMKASYIKLTKLENSHDKSFLTKNYIHFINKY
ncbi:unnamed protein product [Diamesa serratosioi]